MKRLFSTNDLNDRGGMSLASALLIRTQMIGLVVDDVWTTGTVLELYNRQITYYKDGICKTPSDLL